MDALPTRLARSLRLVPDTPAWTEALPVWREALRLASPRTWRMNASLEAFLEAFQPHAPASRDLMRTLEGCRRVALMAVTIGPSLEERAGLRFCEGRPFAGYLLDRMGSHLAEEAMRGLHAGVRREAQAAGGRATRRYSPGYGDFPLQAQEPFLRLVGHGLPGLTLTSGWMLRPEKSVTAVCGLSD